MLTPVFRPILFQISWAFSHLYTSTFGKYFIFDIYIISDQKIAHFMPNNIMGNHGEYFRKCTICVGICCEMIVKQYQNKTVQNNQFGNNVFRLQIGTRNKTILNDQFGNNVFHLKIGTRNKTVLNDQFGNNVLRLQIGTRNKTFLICQLKNNMSIYSWELGTKCSSFTSLSKFCSYFAKNLVLL